MASALRDKSKAFALAIKKVCNTVKNAKHESVLTNQLLRSGQAWGPISVRPSTPTDGQTLSQNCRLP